MERRLEPEHWIERYSDLLYSFAVMRVGDAALAQDLVQETFAAAWEAREGFRGGSSEKTWLFTILRNKITDHFRRQARQQTRTFSELQPGEEESDHAPSFDERGQWRKDEIPAAWGELPAGELERAELQQMLWRCLEYLPERQAAVFQRKYLEQEGSEAICKAMALSASNFWVLIHRAKLRLRKCLEKHYFQRS
jgi:RNA polymerase sigma-70 factor (ECF subfamily)